MLAKPLGPQLAGMAAECDRDPVRGVAAHGSLRQNALQCSAIDPQFFGEATNALLTSPRATTQFGHQRRGVIPSPVAWPSRLSHGGSPVDGMSARPNSLTVRYRSPPAAMRREEARVAAGSES